MGDEDVGKRIVDHLKTDAPLRVTLDVMSPEDAGEEGFWCEVALEGPFDEPFVLARVGAIDPSAALAGGAQAAGTVIARFYAAALLTD